MVDDTAEDVPLALALRVTPCWKLGESVDEGDETSTRGDRVDESDDELLALLDELCDGLRVREVVEDGDSEVVLLGECENALDEVTAWLELADTDADCVTDRDRDTVALTDGAALDVTDALGVRDEDTLKLGEPVWDEL